MKRILIVHTTDLSRAPRALKQIEALKTDYAIDTVGTAESGIENIGFHFFDDHQDYSRKSKYALIVRLLLHKYYEILNFQTGIDRIEDLDSIEAPDLIIAHDPDGFFLTEQLIYKNKWKCNVIFDAHEYEPEKYGNFKYQWINRPHLWFLRKNIKNIDSFITVSPGLASKYEEYFGMKNGTVQVTFNAPFFNDSLRPSETGSLIKLVVHGIATSERRLDILIETMSLLPMDKYTLDMYLVEEEPNYYVKLKKMAQKAGNVRICAPVPFKEIVPILNKYDVFLNAIFPSNYSLKYCLPNKFFEAVQGRLAMVIGPSPEMKSIMEKYDFGACAEGFTARELADTIIKLTPEMIDKYKQNADKCAYELSAESSMKTIKNIVGNLVNRNDAL